MAKKAPTKTTSNNNNKPPTKSEVFGQIAEKTELSKKDVAAVFSALEEQVKKSLKKHQAFTLPGICKMVVKKKPATKARKGRNPFTGEEITIKAKPASKAVRMRPLKNVKEMV